MLWFAVDAHTSFATCHPGTNWTAHQPYNTLVHGDYWLKPGPAGQVLESLERASARQTSVNTVAGRPTAARVAGWAGVNALL